MRLLSSLRALLPQGHTLPYAAWRQRHHAMVGLLFAEALGLTIFSAVQGYGVLHGLAHTGTLVPIGIAALWLEHRRRVASVLVSLGLMTACALLVHVWHGATEAHFLFFVTIVVLALYEDWIPFLVAFAYVVLHHGIAGALEPGAVYDHHDAVAHPWKWAAIHGGFVAAAGIASVIAWRLNETVRADAEASYRRARESEERFKGAFEGAPIGMVLFSFDHETPNEVLQVNRAMCEITGRTLEDLRANAFRNVVHPEDATAGVDAIRGLARGEEEHTQLDMRYIHADGRTVWVAASVSLIRAESGAPGYAIAQVQDITERKRAAEELTYQALHDPLTGLGNRRSLLAELERGIAEATDDRPLLLALFDLDGFKTYNDTFGHPAGDALLMRLARRLETVLDGAATAYRVGGDEFCVLSTAEDPHPLPLLASEALAEQGEGFTVTASYGSVLLPIEATTATEALREADRRMYARKNSDSRSSAGRQSADVLLRILSERSPSLGVHLDEVTGLCNAVAERLCMPDADRSPLLQAASLHDVGKAAIPDEILNKPGPLNDEEWAFMRRHTLIGERILSAAPALSRAAKLVRWSHERFDGRGYPDKLAGKAIPLASRIIAVCDAYDAMVAERPYKEPTESCAAREELRRCAGRQFDPEVVEVFCAVLVEREASTRELTH
ncbi:MAG TPA: HD domain-containing phosphohydrolase [Conexibacter sp.]|jgi:diguanylate cyclase (GGDEF)-like protein/PAS domain S-box-containing protein|nr:HD domain-containing phosphohydrolase [Conexibacter sp.]